MSNNPGLDKTLGLLESLRGTVGEFAAREEKLNQDLRVKTASVQRRRDEDIAEAHALLTEEFKQTMKALKKFIEVSNQHTPYLLRKAQRIEEYLNQH